MENGSQITKVGQKKKKKKKTTTLALARDREIFNEVSKVIHDWAGFNLLRSVIGPENLRHSLNQSDANENQSRLGRPHFPAL